MSETLPEDIMHVKLYRRGLRGRPQLERAPSDIVVVVWFVRRPAGVTSWPWPSVLCQLCDAKRENKNTPQRRRRKGVGIIRSRPQGTCLCSASDGGGCQVRRERMWVCLCSVSAAEWRPLGTAPLVLPRPLLVDELKYFKTPKEHGRFQSLKYGSQKGLALCLNGDYSLIITSAISNSCHISHPPSIFSWKSLFCSCLGH